MPDRRGQRALRVRRARPGLPVPWDCKDLLARWGLPGRKGLLGYKGQKVTPVQRAR